jgi:hypothetical protein
MLCQLTAWFYALTKELMTAAGWQESFCTKEAARGPHSLKCTAYEAQKM